MNKKSTLKKNGSKKENMIIETNEKKTIIEKRYEEKMNQKKTDDSENKIIKKEVKDLLYKKLTVKIPKVNISLGETYIAGEKPKLKHTEYTIYK